MKDKSPETRTKSADGLRRHLALLSPEERAARGRPLMEPASIQRALQAAAQWRNEHPEEAKAINARARELARAPEVLLAKSNAMTGVETTGPRNAKGVGHYRASTGTLRSPDGRTWHYTNRRHFIRTHPELFEPEDVEWRRDGKTPKSCTMTCRAVEGLANLYKAQTHLSWKGWTRADP